MTKGYVREHSLNNTDTDQTDCEKNEGMKAFKDKKVLMKVMK